MCVRGEDWACVDCIVGTMGTGLHFDFGLDSCDYNFSFVCIVTLCPCAHGSNHRSLV